MPGVQAVTRVGRSCSSRTIYNLNGVLNYLYVGWWLRAHGFDGAPRVASRVQLFDRVATDVGDQVVLYLEFGVARGNSIRYGSKLLES